MSFEVAICAENLSKCYQIYDAPKDRLLQMLVRGRKRFYREFWALDDVSLTIARGRLSVSSAVMAVANPPCCN